VQVWVGRYSVPNGNKIRYEDIVLPICTKLRALLIELPIGIMQSSASAAFGKRVRDRRQHLGLSQSALADVVGVNRRVIGELERGKPSVQLSIALRVAEAVGLDVALRERGR
jgi:HTH-type transcriptional regulator/antitoxin HipB